MRARAFLVIKTSLDRRTREPVPSVPVNYHLDRDSTPLVSPRDPLLSLLSIYLFPLSLSFSFFLYPTFAPFYPSNDKRPSPMSVAR